MSFKLETDALTALGHPGRLAVFRLLARRAPDAVRPSEIMGPLGLKQNTLSVYLATLSRAGLVTSERDGRSIYYRINLERIGALVQFLVADCCRGHPELCEPLAAHSLQRLNQEFDGMSDRIFKVLFICTGNSARSIFAEAILNKEGQGKFRAYSAGTRPFSSLNPYAIDLLNQLDYDTSVLRAKNLLEFQTDDAPQFDFVFTVCDHAANEDCPPWPGLPVTAHWGVEDPVKTEGTEGEKALAFREAFRQLHHRMVAFVELPIASLDSISLQKQLDDIARSDAPAPAESGADV